MPGDPVMLRVQDAWSEEHIATLPADPSVTIREMEAKVAEASSSPECVVWRLAIGGKVLAGDVKLGEVPVGKNAEVLASASRLVKLSVPCEVLAVGVLPESGDAVLACRGIKGLPEEVSQRPARGRDDGPSSPFCFWRVSAASGWSFHEAILVARVAVCTDEQLHELWDVPEDQAMLWSEKEISAGRSSGNMPFPAQLLTMANLFLHVHDENYAIFSWNVPDYFGGIGNIDRLDVSTGLVQRLGHAHDIWDVTTDPSDGRIFCTTCYDGTAIQLIQGSTVLEPGIVRPGEGKILANTIGLGFGLSFDKSIGGLVTCGRLDPASFFVVLPPGDVGLYIARAAPGAEEMEALRPPRDDSTPGDRSSPWACVRLPRKGPTAAEKSTLSACVGTVFYLAAGRRGRFELCGAEVVPVPGVAVATSRALAAAAGEACSGGVEAFGAVCSAGQLLMIVPGRDAS